MASENFSSVTERYGEINRRVELAKANRRPNPNQSFEVITVVAVSKTQPKEAILEAYSCGCRDFGENYVNELVSKASDPEILEMCPDIKWHFIGHLQSNKVNKLLGVPNLFMIHTIDSCKLAIQLNTAWQKLNKPHPLKVMIQVNTSREPNKAGYEADFDLIAGIAREIQLRYANLELVGLMTIGHPDPWANIGDFDMLWDMRQLVSLRTQMKNLGLSMGMSSDFEDAIKYGSTYVRIGSGIFGPRENK